MPGRSFEGTLVEFCAPTLMGLKPASLFHCQEDNPAALRQDILRLGRELAPFGLALRVLRTCASGSLIYLYRAAWLRRILAEPDTVRFLEQMDYPAGQSCAALLEQLCRRLRPEDGFPHEIGVFLGYPLEDVVGFIENRGRNYTCLGYWKAYGDPQAAEALFASYRRCTALCRERYRQGTNITQLIAA